MNLSASTLELCREMLRRQIENFYDDPDEYLGVNFDNPEDVNICGMETGRLRVAAYELGVDFDQILDELAPSVKRLESLVKQAMESIPGQNYYIWWLNQEQTESAIQAIESKEIPNYIESELHSRYGRSGRGRLWVHGSIKDRIAVEPWPNTPLAEELGKDSGGIAIRESDLTLIQSLPGVVTDLNLELV